MQSKYARRPSDGKQASPGQAKPIKIVGSWRGEVGTGKASRQAGGARNVPHANRGRACLIRQCSWAGRRCGLDHVGRQMKQEEAMPGNAGRHMRREKVSQVKQTAIRRNTRPCESSKTGTQEEIKAKKQA